MFKNIGILMIIIYFFSFGLLFASLISENFTLNNFFLIKIHEYQKKEEKKEEEKKFSKEKKSKCQRYSNFVDNIFVSSTVLTFCFALSFIYALLHIGFCIKGRNFYNKKDDLKEILIIFLLNNFFFWPFLNAIFAFLCKETTEDFSFKDFFYFFFKTFKNCFFYIDFFIGAAIINFIFFIFIIIMQNFSRYPSEGSFEENFPNYKPVFDLFNCQDEFKKMYKISFFLKNLTKKISKKIINFEIEEFEIKENARKKIEEFQNARKKIEELQQKQASGKVLSQDENNQLKKAKKIINDQNQLKKAKKIINKQSQEINYNDVDIKISILESAFNLLNKEKNNLEKYQFQEVKFYFDKFHENSILRMNYKEIEKKCYYVFFKNDYAQTFLEYKVKFL